MNRDCPSITENDGAFVTDASGACKDTAMESLCPEKEEPWLNGGVWKGESL